jgi:hypothetical protein
VIKRRSRVLSVEGVAACRWRFSTLPAPAMSLSSPQRDRKRAAFAHARCGLNERITRDAGLSIQQRDLPDPLQ